MRANAAASGNKSGRRAVTLRPEAAAAVATASAAEPTTISGARADAASLLDGEKQRGRFGLERAGGEQLHVRLPAPRIDRDGEVGAGRRLELAQCRLSHDCKARRADDFHAGRKRKRACRGDPDARTGEGPRPHGHGQAIDVAEGQASAAHHLLDHRYEPLGVARLEALERA